MTLCPMCSHEFAAPKKEEYICSSCPMGSSCGTVCCPNCNYKFPVESKIVNIIKKITRRS